LLLFFSLTCSGVLFGFATIHDILLEIGAFRETCGALWDEAKPCKNQYLSLDLLFTIGTTATNFVALPAGVFLDKFGPRTTGSIAAAFVFLGVNTVGLAGIWNVSILYHIGFFLLSIGGPVVFMSIISFSNLFPKNTGLITGIVVGCFDASSIILPIFSYLYHIIQGVNFSTFFIIYSAIPLFAAVVSFTCYPNEPFNLPADADDDSQNTKDNKLYTIDYYTLTQQLKSLEFWLTVYTVSIYMLRINFFIQTVGEQTLYNTKYNVIIFGYMLPAAGIVFIPVIGYISDKKGILFAWKILYLSMFLFGILDMLSETYSNSYLNNIIIYSRYLTLVFSRPCLYSFTATYCGRMFGFDTFGTIYGLLFTLCSLVQFLQYVFSFIVEDYCNGSYFYVNLILFILHTSSFIHIILLQYRNTCIKNLSTNYDEGIYDGIVDTVKRTLKFESPSYNTTELIESEKQSLIQNNNNNENNNNNNNSYHKIITYQSTVTLHNTESLV